MVKNPSYEELEQRNVKVKFLTVTVGIDKRRLCRFGLIFTYCLAVLIAVNDGCPSFAEEPLSNRTVLAKGSDTYIPYSFLNEEGKVDGFNNELFQAVAEAAGLKAKIELNPWPIIRKELESGKTDIITGMYYSKEREKLVDFSVPHNIVKYSIFVRDSKIKSLEDLSGKEIIVMQGAISHDFLKEKGITGKVVTTKDTPTALRLLASGKHDGALLVRLQGLYFIKKYKIHNVKAVGEPFKPMKFSFAVREGDSTLLARLNEGLFIIKETGKYDEIYNKWFGILEREAVITWPLLRYIAFILIPLLGLFLVSAIWSWSLRRQVKAKTEDLNVELSERKRAEEALRESEEKYRRLFATESDAIMVFDGETKQFVDVNDAALNLYGYNKEDFLKLRQPDITMEPEKSNESIRQALSGGTTRIPLRSHKKRDGTIFSVEISSGAFKLKNRWMVCGVVRDITERKQGEEAVLESERQLRALAMRLAEVEEAERKRLARELHDRVGQNLTALNINLNIIRGQLSSELKEKVTSRMADSMTLVEEATEHIRDVMAKLRPQVLDDYGLMAALRWYGERFSERTGISLDVRGEDLTLRLLQGAETSFFRIAQEAITNVAKHAHANRATVRLEEVDGLVRLTIADDGVGFDLAGLNTRKGHGWGLITMKERAQAFDGEILIDSEPGKGTRIVVEVKR